MDEWSKLDKNVETLVCISLETIIYEEKNAFTLRHSSWTSGLQQQQQQQQFIQLSNNLDYVTRN